MHKIIWKMQPYSSLHKYPSIEPPSITNIVLHRRYVPRSQYYFCTGHEHLGSPRNVNDEQPLFILPPNNNLSSKTRKQSILGWKLEHKITDSYHASRSSDILRRLHVDGETEAGKTKESASIKAVAIADIDPRYFTELSDQVIDERFSLRSLVNDTKEILRTKVLIEFKREECRRIEQLIERESKRINRFEEDLQLLQNCFEQCLEENYNETVRINDRLKIEADKTKMLEETLDRLTDESEKMQREIYNLENPWKQQKLCQQFLYKLSPESWRIEHDSLNNMNSHEGNTLDHALDKSQVTDNFSGFSLIGSMTHNITEAKPPSLYFQHPKELIRIFNAIEMEKLNALTHLDALSETIKQIVKFVDKTKNEVKVETQKITKEVEQLEKAISLEEQRAEQLENYAKGVLQDVFNSLLNSRWILTLRAQMQEVYSKCIKLPDEEISNLEMMKAIEEAYERLNFELDKFPKDIVLRCERDYRIKKNKMLREAAEAEKEAKRVNRLMAILERIMEPPKKPVRRLVWRSAPPPIKTEKMRPPKPLTEEEILYLDSFTECSKYNVDVQHRSLIPVKLIQQMKEKTNKSVHKSTDSEESVLS